MSWSLLVACTAGAPPAAERGKEPTGWSWASSDTGTPPIDAAVLQADLQANLDATRLVRATDPLRSFVAVMEYASPYCPMPTITTTEDEGSTFYFDQLCETPDMIFKGPALLHTWEEDRVVPVGAMEVLVGLSDEGSWTGYGFNGQTDIFSRDGELDFNCSCTMVDLVGRDSAGNSVFLGLTQGPAHYTGPEGVGSWMDDAGIDPEISVLMTDAPGYREFAVQSITSGVGSRFDAVEFSLSGIAGRLGEDWDCAADSGELIVEFRDSVDAVWHSLTLTTVDSTCALCGSLEGGERVCLDPRMALLAWEGSPWL